jgi:hypothetical protein
MAAVTARPARCPEHNPRGCRDLPESRGQRPGRRVTCRREYGTGCQVAGSALSPSELLSSRRRGFCGLVAGARRLQPLDGAGDAFTDGIVAFVWGEGEVAEPVTVLFGGNSIVVGVSSVVSRAGSGVERIGVVNIIEECLEVRRHVAAVGGEVSVVRALVALIRCSEDRIGVDFLVGRSRVSRVRLDVALVSGPIAIFGGPPTPSVSVRLGHGSPRCNGQAHLLLWLVAPRVSREAATRTAVQHRLPGFTTLTATLHDLKWSSVPPCIVSRRPAGQAWDDVHPEPILHHSNG